MSYDNKIEGRWTITPPLKHDELTEMQRGRLDVNNLDSVKFEQQEIEHQVDGLGRVTQVVISAVVPASEEGHNNFGFDDELKLIAQSFQTLTDSHSVTGYLYFIGEPDGSDILIKRCWYEYGAVSEEVATLRWPDGTEVGQVLNL